MDIQLNELIERIKKDGIDSARTEAAKCKAEAEAEAQRIISDAKREADAILARSKEDAARNEMAGTAALEQASRNLVLAFKGEIQALLDKLISRATTSAYSVDVVKKILPDLVKGWASKNSDSLTVLLSESDLKKIDDAFMGDLSSSLKQGVEVRAVKNFNGGFRIIEQNEAAYYDFSAESVAAMLSAYLTPKLSELLKKPMGGDSYL